ncbi:MAG: hypothetical protein R3B72_44475 [Polyangiaceae bacterium]
MAGDENRDARGTVATVVATAAVTVALGVTAAALGGYLVPMRDGDEPDVAPASEPVLAEAPPAAQSGPPNVVFVPVAPDGTGEPALTPPALPEPDVRFAVYGG